MIDINFLDLKTIPQADVFILPILKEEAMEPLLDLFPQCLKQEITLQLKRSGFQGNEGQIIDMTTNGSYPIPRICLQGVGNQITKETGGQLIKKLLPSNQKRVAILYRENSLEMAFGMLLRSWSLSYKTRRNSDSIQVLFLTDKNVNEVRKAFEPYSHLFEGIKLARQLTAEPANILYPSAFAKKCEALASFGIQVDVLDEKALEKIGAHALLSVGQGSQHPPRLISLQWNGAGDGARPLAIVGKGICYDSGGINLKKSNLLEMKWDKAGGAAVAGTLLTLALQKFPANVVGIIALAENMLSGTCLKPGDVIKTMSEQTVEIADTDNEGRLVLADAL